MRFIAIGRPIVSYVFLWIDFIIGRQLTTFHIFMGKSKQYFMDLNRETAMRLWSKSFGKEIKTTDFAGRTIVKGAYNDRNSEYGWNVDHILPQSKGGVTADYNLVCCHILTNDEKADKFPCFNANSSAYEIVKVQNHYEIRCKNNKSGEQKEILSYSDYVGTFARRIGRVD